MRMEERKKNSERKRKGLSNCGTSMESLNISKYPAKDKVKIMSEQKDKKKTYIS